MNLENLQQELNKKVTIDNLLDPKILELSQKLDVEIVKAMKKQVKS